MSSERTPEARDQLHRVLAQLATQPTDDQVLVAMRTYGGSFVQHLAELMPYADARNQQRLREAFPEYFAEYEQIARLALERGASLTSL